ncbi:MAG: hypothetical protein KDE63_08685 [Novosphingobium sp.]|nr:hypothetical protein [Novosphingobium sp.]
MSDLRESAERIARMGRFPTPADNRKLACEKAVARLQERPIGSLMETEPWDDFLHRIGVI